jgi:hypothetical protein
VVIAIGAAATLTDRARVAEPDPVSLTLTVKLAIPDVVGVPVIWPEVPRLNPAGNAPEVIDHVYVPVPPLACNVCAYATPIWAFGRDAVVMVTGADPTVMLSAREAKAEFESTTFTVKLVVPIVIGVPVICDPNKIKPGGSAPAEIDHV